MQIKFNILQKGDTVINAWDSHIAIKKVSGDVEIYSYYLDDDGFPRLEDNTLLITQGDGSISTMTSRDLEITTF